MNDRQKASLGALSGEVSGAFGDLGTFLPYVIAALATGLFAPVPVFLGFAAGYLTVAALYRLPIAVQPMKALGAMILAGGLSAAETRIAGVAIGAALLVLALSPALARAARAIPQSVVTGLQAGLGLMLGWVAVTMMRGDWVLAAPVLTLLGLSLVWPKGPWAILAVAGAVVFGHAVPGPAPMPPVETGTSLHAILAGLLAQLPLTLLNAVVVTAALARALFPGRADTVTERRLAATSGVLNLLAVPFGALPMCHGAGGLAAHYRFGARSWGAPALLATACGAAALAGPSVMALLTAIPLPAVGALLAWAATDLIFTRRMFDARPDCRPVIAAAAVVTFVWGALAGLVAGLAAETLRARLRRARHRHPGP